MRMAPPRLATQELTKVATASQLAVPRDGEASFCSAYDTTPLGFQAAHESGDSFAVCSSPWTARLQSGLRMTPPRWASQEPTKTVTVSQFAALQDGRSPGGAGERMRVEERVEEK